jgi:hypothetical protein
MDLEQPSGDPNLEQRRSPRVDLFQEIVCARGDVVARSRVANISVGGMFVDLFRLPFPTGSRITTRFALHDDDPRLLVDAEVNYVQERIGMGLRFLDLVEADRERIGAFVDEAVRRRATGAPPVRKSARVCVQVPIRLRATLPDGRALDERTSIITLSKHGACLVSGNPLAVGMKLFLETPSSGEFKGNVVWVGCAASRSEGQVGVQCRGLAQALGFDFPSEPAS